MRKVCSIFDFMSEMNEIELLDFYEILNETNCDRFQEDLDFYADSYAFVVQTDCVILVIDPKSKKTDSLMVAWTKPEFRGQGFMKNELTWLAGKYINRKLEIDSKREELIHLAASLKRDGFMIEMFKR
jgi:hypothetical protein